MQYRLIPKTGEKISALGFGCMRLPEKRGKIDENRAKKQLYHAIEKGVNYFDTAMPYHMGASEPFLGKIFKGDLRKKLNLATKLPPLVCQTVLGYGKIVFLPIRQPQNRLY